MKLSSCLLHVYVDSCQGLVAGGKNISSGAKPSPRVEIKMGQEEPQTTFPQYFSHDPVFEQV